MAQIDSNDHEASDISCGTKPARHTAAVRGEAPHSRPRNGRRASQPAPRHGRRECGRRAERSNLPTRPPGAGDAAARDRCWRGSRSDGRADAWHGCSCCRSTSSSSGIAHTVCLRLTRSVASEVIRLLRGHGTDWKQRQRPSSERCRRRLNSGLRFVMPLHSDEGRPGWRAAQGAWAACNACAEGACSCSGRQFASNLGRAAGCVARRLRQGCSTGRRGRDQRRSCHRGGLGGQRRQHPRQVTSWLAGARRRLGITITLI